NPRHVSRFDLSWSLPCPARNSPMRQPFGWLLLAALAASVWTAEAARAAHCGACAYPVQYYTPAQACLPRLQYQICYRPVVEEQTQVCYGHVYRTVLKECRSTVCKPVYEQHWREHRYTVCRPVWETYEVPRKYTVYKPLYEQHVRECRYHVLRPVYE